MGDPAADRRLATKLLDAAVRLRGIQLGRPVDVLFDPGITRIVGLEVRCEDGANRFLPWSVAQASDPAIEVTVALALLERDELDFYDRHAARLSVLRGMTIELESGDTGALGNVVVDASGRVTGLVLSDGREVEVGLARVNGSIRLAPAQAERFAVSRPGSP